MYVVVTVIFVGIEVSRCRRVEVAPEISRVEIAGILIEETSAAARRTRISTRVHGVTLLRQRTSVPPSGAASAWQLDASL